MLNELKSRAWDELQQVELWKQKLQQTQQEIINYQESEITHLPAPTEDVDLEVIKK